MAAVYVSLLLVVFVAGFHLGKMYMVKGLSLRIQQLYEDGYYRDAKLFETILDKDKNQK